jgi:uncharacterized protein (DUF362 family)
MPHPISRRALLKGSAFASTAPAVMAGRTRRPQSAAPPAVSIVPGESRRQMVHDALVAVDAEIAPVLATKKYVLIKPNLVSVNTPLACTHVDTLRGVLDYIAPRFDGPVVIAESSADDTWTGFRNMHHTDLVDEYKSQNIVLVDLNDEGRYQLLQIMDSDLHAQSVRLAARLFDPDAFLMSVAMMKTHDTVVATLSVKNLAMGAPLHQKPGEKVAWSDKRLFHQGFRQSQYDMFLTAQKLSTNWGAAVIDGFDGMEGNGPISGTAVPSRLALASADPVAADRVGLELMGIDPEWVGYLKYCGQAGIGEYDLSRIELRGPDPAGLKRNYRLHDTMQSQLGWLGPLPACR